MFRRLDKLTENYEKIYHVSLWSCYFIIAQWVSGHLTLISYSLANES